MLEPTADTNHFSEAMDEINQGEFNILSNLTNELANQFINKILALLQTGNVSPSTEEDVINTSNILDIVKYLDYDNDNNRLLVNALKKSFEVLRSYNIHAYYLAFYEHYNKEHEIKYHGDGSYYIIDDNGIERTIGLNVFSLSKICFKTTRSNVATVYNYLKNRLDNKLKIKKVNNQLNNWLFFYFLVQLN